MTLRLWATELNILLWPVACANYTKIRNFTASTQSFTFDTQIRCEWIWSKCIEVSSGLQAIGKIIFYQKIYYKAWWTNEDMWRSFAAQVTVIMMLCDALRNDWRFKRCSFGESRINNLFWPTDLYFTEVAEKLTCFNKCLFQYVKRETAWWKGEDSGINVASRTFDCSVAVRFHTWRA